jgi:dipeptidyl aminopeptidase/acylaminoacyl peptidase
VLIVLPGRAAQARAELDLFVQYCVNELQIAVLAPDLRGASGHGHAFQSLDQGESGWGAALDLGALLAWIGAQPDLQREHVALLGRNEGGTQALAGAGLYADRIRAAVSMDGTASTAQLAAIRQPVLLLRGLSEPVLDAGSAEQLLWQLRNAGTQVWYLGPKDADGRLGGRASQAAVERAIAQFLDQFLVHTPA